MSSRTIDLSPARWARVEKLFDEAAELATGERAAFLNSACADDPELRAYVISLLDSDMAQSTLVDNSIRDVLAETMEALNASPDRAGMRIGPYRVVRSIGSGGMGVVYLAERADEQFEQQVAIKVVRQRLLDPEVEARLRSERQILANLDHPNIARLFDGGTTDEGTPYLVMEYIEGLPIDAYCDREQLSVAARLELFRQVCGAIHYAHRNLVVHRDIKASNILVTPDGTPKLLDFGIARLLDAGGGLADGLTQLGKVVLTPDNAAPEQVTNGAITTATDTYALGLLLYRLLTDQAPYTVDLSRPRDIPRIVCETEPPPPSVAVGRADRRYRRLQGDVDNIVRMALRKEPERRYRSVNEFAEDLRRHLQSHPVLARPDTWHYRASRFVRRHTAVSAMSAMLALLLLAFAVTMSVQNRRIAEERDTAMEISAFLEDIFREPDPGNARGASITAREILGKGAARVATELDDQPAIQASLMSTIGRVYYNLGEYDPSIDMLQQALGIRLELFGDGDAQVAESRDELAVSLTRKAEYDRARELLDEALRRNRALHGDNSPEVAGNLTNLAELYQAVGDQAAAEASARAAVDVYARLAETRPTELAEAQSLLSRILLYRKRLDEAETLQRNAIEIVETRLGHDHPLLAYYKQNLAILVQGNGDLDEAERLFNEAIDTTRRTLGEEHSLLGGSLVMLGRLLHQRQRLDAAETAFRDALRVHRIARGDSHPYVGYDKASLGSLLKDKGELAAAETELREALDIFELSLSPRHQYVAMALTELGAVLNEDQRAAEATPLLARALDIQRQDFAAGHPVLAATQVVAGRNYILLGRYAEARVLLQESYDVLREEYGDDDRRTVRARQWLTAATESLQN